MQLKAPQRRGPSWLTRTLVGRVVAIVLAGTTALILIAGGAYLRGSGWFGEAKLAVERGVRFVPNWLETAFVTPPRITIDCKHKYVQQLAAKRDAAVELGHLLTSSDDFVPATVRYTDEAGELVGPLKAQIRLKGDVIDHLEGAKWSFRVHLSGDATLSGMKRFSLHHPKTRNYLAEWAYQRALAREDVLTLRYQFVGVTINGRDLGIYAMEEHFGKRLVEHNRRREGPIVRFNEDMFWREKVQQEVPFPESQRNESGEFTSSEVDGFQTSSVLADPVQRALFVRAADRLERFRSGELKTSEVFDVDLLARYYAVTDLFAGEHGARWINERFYYNPVTTRIEPIGFDSDSGGPCEGLCGVLEGNYIGAAVPPPPELYWAHLFSDPVFFRAYVRELERVSDPSYVRELLLAIRPDLEKALAILHKEFVDCELDEEMLYRNQRYIASVLSPVRAMHAYARAVDARHVAVEMAAIEGLPVEVHGISYGKTEVAHFDDPVVLPGRRPGAALAYHEVTVALPDGVEITPKTLSGVLEDLSIDHSIFGRADHRTEKVLAWSRTLGPVEAEGVPAPTDLSTVPFVQVDRERRHILLSPGQHRIDHDLVFPAGWVVRAIEGTELDLVQSAAIVSRSPVELVGSRDDPVLIHTSDGTGQGLAVLDAGGRSTLSGVVFRGLRAPERPGWRLTGAVTFYQSPVIVDNCRFEDQQSEDAINVVRAPFRIEQSVFVNAHSDAVDGDFCPDSLIVDSRFADSGNDAIDVSGSQLEVRDVVIERSADKGLSAGENSEIVARNVTIQDTEIAVASKDLSKVTLYFPKVVRCKVGFTAFQKKPEFGPSEIQTHGMQCDAERPFLIEEGSRMNDGSHPIPTVPRGVEKLLYGAQYGKSSH